MSFQVHLFHPELCRVSERERKGRERELREREREKGERCDVCNDTLVPAESVSRLNEEEKSGSSFHGEFLLSLPESLIGTGALNRSILPPVCLRRFGCRGLLGLTDPVSFVRSLSG